MPRERKEFVRASFIRDVQRLFVIASEGQKTEVKYFEEFRSPRYYNNQLIYLEVIKRLTSQSSPSNIIKQLNKFKLEFRLREGDSLWMIIDRDKQSWSSREIADVARLCVQKKYGFALTNPCFELWLLLHRKDLNDYSDIERQELLSNRKSGNRTKLELELLSICGSYNKSNLKVDDYLPFINDAIERAEALVQNQRERWPSGLGSHVFKLVKQLLT